MGRTQVPVRGLARKPLRFVAGMCVAGAAVTAGGCSSSHTAAHQAGGVVIGRGPSVGPTPASISAVKHWGSFFGDSGGEYDQKTLPTAVHLPGTVAQVGTSNSTEYALLSNGRVYAWGMGTEGQLGNGTDENSFEKPVLVHFPAGVTIAYLATDAMPYDSALAVDSTGHAWAWGDNSWGEFCLGNAKVYKTPVELPFSDVTTLAGANGHALYDAGGTVYACGDNLRGDLGDGSTAPSMVPVQVPGLGPDVVTLVAAFANSGALLWNGDYFDWGYNQYGQLGDGQPGGDSDVPVRVDLPMPVAQVAQGGSIWANGQTLVLLTNNTLWSWGSNWSYQLGDGTTTARSRPAQIYPPAGVVYQSLATGSGTGYGITADGKVYAWGANYAGQVGNGSTKVTATPVVVATGATSVSATANNVLINTPEAAG
jgi:alpha-tubulin suppressor-like RCC1 family protein